MKDYFSTLGVPRYASEDQIKEAYRRLAMRWHPDANPLDEKAERRMQDLNRAKEVLFDKETREEYRRVLHIQDQLSYEHIQGLRTKYESKKEAATVIIDEAYPYKRRNNLIAILSIIILFGAGAFYLYTSRDKPAADPLQAIVERHDPLGRSQSEPEAAVAITVSAQMAERIASRAAMMGDFRTAINYWTASLENNEHNPEIVTSLALSYIKIKNFSAAFATIERYLPSPQSKLLVYALLGDYFHSLSQHFDAEDMYKKAIELAPMSDTNNVLVMAALKNARAEIRQ